MVAAAVSLLALAALLSWQVRGQQRSALERRLDRRSAADRRSAVAGDRAWTARALDAEADRLGQLVSSRITFVAEDGRVVGDSTQPAEHARHARESRVASGGRRRARAGHRHQPAIQHDGGYRHAVRRRSCVAPGGALRAPGPAADRRRRTAGGDSTRGADGDGRRDSAGADRLVDVVGAAGAAGSGDRAASPIGIRPAICRDRPTTTAPTSSARSRARSMRRCRSWADGSKSCRAIARAWRRFSPAWSKACSSSIGRDGCSS